MAGRSPAGHVSGDGQASGPSPATPGERAAVQLLNGVTLDRTISRMAHEMAEHFPEDGTFVVVGIQKGGVHLARRLAAHLEPVVGRPVAHGELDVSLYRDDLVDRAAPVLRPTRLPVDITGGTVVLVDDVLYTGRTVRAAMDALNDFGRPGRIRLAVLVDRGLRELPIMADHVGRHVTTTPAQRVRVCWGVEEGGDGEGGVYLEEGGVAS